MTRASVQFSFTPKQKDEGKMMLRLLVITVTFALMVLMMVEELGMR